VPTKKIRIYELARELGVENEVVLDLATELKIGVKSHSSSIEDPMADRVRRLADSKGLRKAPIEEPAAPAKPAPKAAASHPTPATPAVDPTIGSFVPPVGSPTPTSLRRPRRAWSARPGHPGATASYARSLARPCSGPAVCSGGRCAGRHRGCGRSGSRARGSGLPVARPSGR